MHAALVKLTIDPDQAPAAANALTHAILPKIRSAPGFVAGGQTRRHALHVGALPGS